MSKRVILTTVGSAKHLSSYHNKWFTDEVFLQILKSRLNLPDSVTKDKLNNILTRHVIDFDSNGIPNEYQLFSRTNYNVDQQGRIFCYFLCSNSGETPPLNINWSHSIHYTFIEAPITRPASK